MLQITARPFGPLLLVCRSGCAATMFNVPRITVPLLLMTIGKLEVPEVTSPGGITKVIAVELTLYNPQAAPRTETETPFNSTGSEGANCNSEAFAVVPDDGAKLTLELITASSPAANPGAIKGVPGEGLGLGDGVGLPLGTEIGGATGTKLAPVNNEIVSGDSVVIVGERL